MNIPNQPNDSIFRCLINIAYIVMKCTENPLDEMNSTFVNVTYYFKMRHRFHDGYEHKLCIGGN